MIPVTPAKCDRLYTDSAMGFAGVWVPPTRGTDDILLLSLYLLYTSDSLAHKSYYYLSERERQVKKCFLKAIRLNENHYYTPKVIKLT